MTILSSVLYDSPIHTIASWRAFDKRYRHVQCWWASLPRWILCLIWSFISRFIVLHLGVLLLLRLVACFERVRQWALLHFLLQERFYWRSFWGFVGTVSWPLWVVFTPFVTIHIVLTLLLSLGFLVAWNLPWGFPTGPGPFMAIFSPYNISSAGLQLTFDLTCQILHPTAWWITFILKLIIQWSWNPEIRVWYRSERQ